VLFINLIRSIFAFQFRLGTWSGQKKKDTQLALKENGSWENNGRCTQNGNVTSYFSEEEIIVIEAHFQTRKLARTRE
jgi:hypothetical protein